MGLGSEIVKNELAAVNLLDVIELAKALRITSSLSRHPAEGLHRAHYRQGRIGMDHLPTPVRVPSSLHAIQELENILFCRVSFDLDVTVTRGDGQIPPSHSLVSNDSAFQRNSGIVKGRCEDLGDKLTCLNNSNVELVFDAPDVGGTAGGS